MLVPRLTCPNESPLATGHSSAGPRSVSFRFVLDGCRILPYTPFERDEDVGRDFGH
jgi:hypothetical protein